MAGWWVTAKAVSTKHGQPMEFVTFEDTTATFETTFFPRAYDRYCRKLTRHRPYLLRGKVEEEFGVATLNVQWMGGINSAEPLDKARGPEPVEGGKTEMGVMDFTFPSESLDVCPIVRTCVRG
jgi:error-prone DNA polymerase